ncbi:MAG TPA: ferredoxin reductase family protein [Candidatus Hydrogenedentes bacterium]|nr:ferredoxin reductase family protein [Candidatus Hydrogenedentota bacterium]
MATQENDTGGLESGPADQGDSDAGRAETGGRPDRAFQRFSWYAVYAVLVLLPATLAAALRDSWSSHALVEIGRFCALTGFSLLALQVALTARLKWLDRPFGIDRVTGFHRNMAVVAGLLLAAHPILLAAGRETFMLFQPWANWRLGIGQLAWVFLFGVVGAALARKDLFIDYQVWRVLHKGAIGLVVLGFVHGLAMPSDTQHTTLRVYFWALLALAGGLFLWRNLYAPFFGRRKYRVADVSPETHDTFTLRMEPVGHEGFRWDPGQFMFLKLRRPGRRSEEHPFTIAASPTEKTLKATVKQSGDFTNTIDRTQPDDTALVEAPFGRFSLVHEDAPRFLFLAGGVGITPIVSMLRFMRDTGDDRPALLIYCNNEKRDIIFRDELDALPDNITVVHVLAKPDEHWTGPSGWLTEEKIGEHAGAFLEDAHVYLCGPPPMMRKVLRYLRSLGVDSGRIHYERFSL